MKNQILLLTIILALIGNLLKGQNVEVYIHKSNIEVLADSLFSQKQYSQALGEYEKLVEQFPQDPNFHLKLGVCYLYSTRHMQKAIHNLKFASTRQVTNMVYYYLAEALRHSYQFDEAISYYRRFIINGGDSQVPTQLIERRVGQCENGNFMIRFIYQPEVLDRKSVPNNDFLRYINTKSPRGNFIPKPNDLKTTLDIKNEDASVIFYPHNPEPGDKIFYSSYGSTTSFGKDIFMIELQNDGYWSKPKNLGDEINTAYDEDFPYMADDGVTLYFASKGHYSMGGYDIYRSVFNPSTKQWSTPENLGFPFSSPHNDFLYVPDYLSNMATLITDRNHASDSVEVVLLPIDEKPIRRPFDHVQTVWDIAMLSPIDMKPTDRMQPAAAQGIPEQKMQAKAASFSAVENDPEYSRALTQGFLEQMKADSLRVRLEKLRERFDHIYTAEDRRTLESQVVKVEDALLEAQRLADGFFARASQIEQEYITGKRKPLDQPTKTFASDKPEFLYQAQFAPTVFQTDEINRLARVEKLTPQIENLRRELLTQKQRLKEIEISEPDSYDQNPDYELHVRGSLQKISNFSRLLSNQISEKKLLYRECISVALVKRGASNDPIIKSEIDRANQHFRSASAIRNNANPEDMIYSEHEAILLDEIGVLRLELAFSKLWGMKLFEQEILSKIYRLEQNIFGRTLATITPQVQTTQRTEPQYQPTSQETIIKRESESEIDIETETILFEPAKDPEFKVVGVSPYDKNNPIPIDKPFPNGVIYRIQVAAFSNPVAVDFFKGMVPISGERVSGGKVTKYYIGNFRMLSEAEKALPIVRSKGFRDAFVVAWHNGRSVSLSRAKSLELLDDQQVDRAPQIDIVQDSKLYMVQIGQFQGRLPEDVVQTVRALAPGKDIVRKPDQQGGFIYSVGSYTDPVEATRVKDNLIGSGIKNAFVIAVDFDNN